MSTNKNDERKRFNAKNPFRTVEMELSDVSTTSEKQQPPRQHYHAIYTSSSSSLSSQDTIGSDTNEKSKFYPSIADTKIPPMCYLRNHPSLKQQQRIQEEEQQHHQYQSSPSHKILINQTSAPSHLYCTVIYF